ncbi:MAG TPA: hypothetical protein VJM31_00005 [Vicinamibacterales bacterium]|nr:hypothetical protein [Vicinamibacterales bacterium]
MDSNRTRIKVVEIYYLDGDQWMRCVYTKGGYLEKPAVSPYVDEDGVPVNPICSVSAHIDRDNNRYGVVRQLIGVQDEINKRRSKALHLITMRQVLSERGAVDDIKKAKAEMAKPDGWVEYTPGMKLEIANTDDMAAGNMALLQEAKAEIDAVGANAALQGKQEGQQSGRALQSRQQSGLVELGPVFDSLRHWQRLIHRQVWYRIKQYWKAPMWVRVTDDEQSPKYVGLNQPMMAGDLALEQLKEKKDQRAGQFEQIWMGVKQSPDPMMALVQAGLPPTLLQPTVQNDVSKMDMDIIIAEAPDTVNLQGEQFEMLGEMYKASLASPDPKDHIPFEIVLEASSLRGKQKLLAKLKGEDDEQAQQAQMAQQQEAMQLQKAGAMAELAIKQSEARLKNAQAAKTEREAMVVAPEQGQPDTGMSEAALKAETDLRKTEMSGQFELEKTAMQQQGETQRHVMSLGVERERADVEHGLAMRDQDMRAQQADKAAKPKQ